MNKILLIEDEDNLRESISKFLTDEGFITLEAKDGTDGVKLAKAELPDLIICDIIMPEMDGHTVLKKLAEDPNTSTTPFIFLTALNEMKDLRTGMLLGADDYITKPFETEDLLKSIKIRLKKAADTKSKLDSLRNNITVAIPHEFHTPLVSIVGYSEILMERCKAINDTESLEFASSIHKAGLRLNRIIKNFVAYSRLEVLATDTGEKKKIIIIPLEIDEGLVSRFSKKIADRYNRFDDLSLKIIKGVAKISSDDFLLIYEELLDNAFKFSKAGSKVEVSNSFKNENVIFQFKDYGRGITKEQLANIGAYQQFERQSFEQQGIGLGLIVSKKLVEFYGGKLNLESTYKEQTTVTIILPVS